jgi:hypothetical protein
MPFNSFDQAGNARLEATVHRPAKVATDPSKGAWRIFVSTVTLLLLSQLLISANLAERRFENVDEIAHLPSGISHFKFLRFDLYRVNPPLIRSLVAVPALLNQPRYDWLQYSDAVGKRPEFEIGRKQLRSEGLQIHYYFRVPRLVNILFGVLATLLLTVVCLCNLGRTAAVVACAFSFTAPDVLAHGTTICPDVGAGAIGLWACVSAFNYLHDPCSKSALWAGQVLGFAMLAKLPWLTAALTLPIMALVCLLLFWQYLPERTWQRRSTDLLLFCCIALLTLNAGYLFEETFQPLGEYEFCSEMLGGEGCNASVHGNRFENTWLANVPVPVPRNYLLGIDYLKYEVEEKKWSFLNGEWKFGSWPYYYVMTTLYKTPEPTLVGALVGLGVLVMGIRRRLVKPKVISLFFFLIIPAAVCFASVSLQGGFNHHHRYVLMIYPPMFALAAYIASPVGIKLLRFRLPFFGPKKRSIAVPLAITLVTLSAISSLRVHPYYTSYFNTLSGGPENGWRLLGFSNIDWGQDILEVDKWLKAHPDRRPLVMDIDYFGMNGNLFDVSTSDPPLLPKGASIDEVRKSITETQWWIISVKKLYNLPDRPGLEYLQQIQPVERIAYAYHVYRIDPLPADP